MAAKDELGQRGERIAERHLVARGLTVLDRNWRCPQGEIDLVLRDGDETVFVEVKTRTSTAYGHPLEAITVAKLARLRRLAAAWCAAHPGVGRIRIDAVAVVAPHRAPATVEHLERVF
jgi:putative endonuclease